jgi:pimeloyl-ACP methyl ester carboxylesterase
MTEIDNRFRYFAAEKRAGALASPLGALAFGFSFDLWRTGNAFRAMGWPLLPVGLIGNWCRRRLLFRKDAPVASPDAGDRYREARAPARPAGAAGRRVPAGSGPRGVPQFLDMGDHRLEYAWHGPAPAEAPTLVFLHEGLGSVSTWRDFPARLARAAGCGALVYSRRGYGGSDPAPLPRSVRFMHEEAMVTLPRVLERLGVMEPILVGESDGASIALIYAGGADAGARRARGLLLEAPHVFVEEVCLQSIATAAESYRRGDLKGALARHHARDVDATFRGWSEVWLDPAFTRWNIEKFLPGVGVPVLAIQGEEDPYGTLGQVESVAANCRGYVEVLVLPRCGHSPHREVPERAFETMARFLKREILESRSNRL